MISQLTPVSARTKPRTQQPSFLFNTSLITALQALIGPIEHLTSGARPKVLCLGQDSDLIPGLIADRLFKPLSCRFTYKTRETLVQVQSLPATEQAEFDAIVLLVDPQFALTQTLLDQLRLQLKRQGRLIIVAPYQASFVTVLQKSLGMGPSTGPCGLAPKAFSVNALFRLLQDEGYGDPYLRLVGGLPGFWNSVVCSVTPHSALLPSLILEEDLM